MRVIISIVFAFLVWESVMYCDTYRIYAAPRQTMIMPGDGRHVDEISCEAEPKWKIPENMRGWHFGVTAANENGESDATFVQDIVDN